MYKSPEWGTVVLGVDVLQGHGEQSQPGKADYDRNHSNFPKGKQQYNPGRNQELNLPPDIFRMSKQNEKNPFSTEGRALPEKGVHERIKEMLGEGMPRKEAIAKAKSEASKVGRGDIGTLLPKEYYRSKYQAVTPEKQPSVFSEQVQNYPFI